MQPKDELTVEQTLAMLSEALGKASNDLTAVRAAVDLARSNMASHNGSHTRAILKDTERALDHLRETDESLRSVLNDLRESD